MATPDRDSEGRELLPDDEFERIRSLSDDEFAKLPADLQNKFKATSRWHFDQRASFGEDDLQAMNIGGQSFAEALAEARRAKGQQP